MVRQVTLVEVVVGQLGTRQTAIHLHIGIKLEGIHRSAVAAIEAFCHPNLSTIHWVLSRGFSGQTQVAESILP